MRQTANFNAQNIARLLVRTAKPNAAQKRNNATPVSADWRCGGEFAAKTHRFAKNNKRLLLRKINVIDIRANNEYNFSKYLLYKEAKCTISKQVFMPTYA